MQSIMKEKKLDQRQASTFFLGSSLLDNAAEVQRIQVSTCWASLNSTVPKSKIGNHFFFLVDYTDSK